MGFRPQIKSSVHVKSLPPPETGLLAGTHWLEAPASSAWKSVITVGGSNEGLSLRGPHVSLDVEELPPNMFKIRTETHVYKHVITCSYMYRETMFKQNTVCLHLPIYTYNMSLKAYRLVYVIFHTEETG